MNFYASHAFVETLNDVYFPDRPGTVRDLQLEGEVFRLLVIPGRGPVRRWPFLDYHEPLGPEDAPHPDGELDFLSKASLGLYTAEDYQTRFFGEHFTAAPTVRWDGVRDWQDYEAMLRSRSSLVKDDARRRRRLGEQVGPLHLEVDDPGDDVLPFAVDVKGEQMRRTLGVSLFDDPRNERFLRALRERGLLLATTLRAGGRLLAVWLGAIHEGRWYGWIFAYDPDPALRRYSLGRQLLYAMLRESLERGHRELDFSIGDEDYKWYFATHARAVGPLGAPPITVRVRKVVARALRGTPLETPARRLHQVLR